MAIMQRVNWLGNQRVDTYDLKKVDDFICADFDLIFKTIFSQNSVIVRGFELYQDIDTTDQTFLSSPVYVKVADSATIHSDLAQGPLFFVGNEDESPEEVNLTANATNYIELSLISETGANDARIFWDPTAEGGAGSEFSQSVDTVLFLGTQVTVNTSGFSGGTKIPLFEVVVNSGGSIVGVYDARDMLYRLAKGFPHDQDYQYPWSDGREDSRLTLTLSTVSGTFEADETITGGTSGTTAIVVSVGVGSLVVKFRSQSQFTIGEQITGSASGATANIDKAIDSFTSSDKSINTLKDWLDAFMTELGKIKFGSSSGSKYWTEESNFSLGDIFLDSQMTIMTGGGTVSWSGTQMAFTADISVNVLTQTTVYTIEQAIQSPITIADGEVAYIDLSEGSGRGVSGTRTIYVVPREDLPFSNDTFWIAYRNGAKLQIHGVQHEFESGEEGSIDEGLGDDLFTFIGSTGETDSDPAYSSTHYVVQGTSLTTSISALDLALYNHASDTTIHFTKGSISHTQIQDIGTHTHPQIDSHINDSTIHFTVGSIDHGAIGGLGDDDHPQYAGIAQTETISGDWTHTGNLFVQSDDLPDSDAEVTRQSLAKAWISVANNGNGLNTATVFDSYNISSLSGPDGSDEYTITFDRDFSSVNYVIAGACAFFNDVGGANQFHIGWRSKSTGSCNVQTSDDTGNLNPIADFDLVFFGVLS